MHKHALKLNLGNAAKKAGDEDKHKAAESDGDVGLVVQLVAAVEQILVLDAQGFQFLGGTVVSVMRIIGIISME